MTTAEDEVERVGEAQPDAGHHEERDQRRLRGGDGQEAGSDEEARTPALDEVLDELRGARLADADRLGGRATAGSRVPS
mgnify:CR=1 FL=1